VDKRFVSPWGRHVAKDKRSTAPADRYTQRMLVLSCDKESANDLDVRIAAPATTPCRSAVSGNQSGIHYEVRVRWRQDDLST
jgi:hypothetical protein